MSEVDQILFNLDKVTLGNLIAVAKAADPTLPTLRQINILSADGTVTLSATDRYVIAWTETPSLDEYDPAFLTLPVDQARQIHALMSTGVSKIGLSRSPEGSVRVSVSGRSPEPGTFTFRDETREHNTPAYDRLVSGLLQENADPATTVSLGTYAWSTLSKFRPVDKKFDTLTFLSAGQGRPVGGSIGPTRFVVMTVPNPKPEMIAEAQSAPINLPGSPAHIAQTRR